MENQEVEHGNKGFFICLDFVDKRKGCGIQEEIQEEAPGLSERMENCAYTVIVPTLNISSLCKKEE